MAEFDADIISRLPLEIVFMVIALLPVPALISFGATSRANYSYHLHCMRKLHLAIFQRRLHATMAFLDFQRPNECGLGPRPKHPDELSHRIPIILPRSRRGKDSVPCRPVPLRSRGSTPVRGRRIICPNPDDYPPRPVYQTVRLQNEVFAKIINRYGRSLVDVQFLAYDLNTQGAMAVAKCGPKLRHLGLRFEHPYVRDGMVGRNFWFQPPPGSPGWNALIGVGDIGKNAGLTNLESLVLERAGITSWQLRMLVKRNPKLKELRLRTCAAVQPEFVNWLGGIEIEDPPPEESRKDGDPVPGALLEILWLENCEGLSTRGLPSDSIANLVKRQDTGLEWVRELKSLKVSIRLRKSHS
jgi:hypothetical protein